MIQTQPNIDLSDVQVKLWVSGHMQSAAAAAAAGLWITEQISQ